MMRVMFMNEVSGEGFVVKTKRPSNDREAIECAILETWATYANDDETFVYAMIDGAVVSTGNSLAIRKATIIAGDRPDMIDQLASELVSKGHVGPMDAMRWVAKMQAPM